MRNITLILKNPKDDSKIDIVSYTNVEDSCANDGFFCVYTKEKNSNFGKIIFYENLQKNSQRFFYFHRIAHCTSLCI